MEEVILNGDLYIKEAPDLHVNIEYNHKIETEISIKDQNGERIIDIYNPEELLSLPKNILDSLQRAGLIKINEELDYRQNAFFYQIYMTATEIIMLDKTVHTKRVYHNLKEVKDRYINFRTFIEKALYIGKYLKKDDEENLNNILLYEYNNTYLIKDLESNLYVPVSKYNPSLEQYKMGPFISEYYEKNSLYQDIIKQELKHNRGLR